MPVAFVLLISLSLCLIDDSRYVICCCNSNQFSGRHYPCSMVQQHFHKYFKSIKLILLLIFPFFFQFFFHFIQMTMQKKYASSTQLITPRVRLHSATKIISSIWKQKQFALNLSRQLIRRNSVNVWHIFESHRVSNNKSPAFSLNILI